MSRLAHLPRVGAWLVAKRKFAAKAILLSLALLLISIALVALLQGYLIDAIYKNVDDLTDGEMPATIVSYPSGPEVVGILGGSGEGLNCSLPPGIDVFFDGSPDASGYRHLVRQQFRQACVAHDLCYRHGLATYGYNQNDCDRILQNQAFRLCKYFRSENDSREQKHSGLDADRCQQDSKRVLAGVSLGGFRPYRGWDRSTYFEFDSDPIRSNFYSVSRVVDHPFKSADPEKYKDDPPQVILTFFNKHSDLTVDCTTCKTGPRRPNPIWLPPRRNHAAPHLVVDGAGKHRLVWMSRVHPENTGSCLVWADAATVLTDTLPKEDFCNAAARSPLTLVQPEMYASSPRPLVLPEESSPNDIVATGLSPQLDRDHSLSLCIWSERIRKTGEQTGGDEAICSRLRDPSIDSGKGLGAFQNFSVARPGQEIFFAREVSRPPASNWLIEFWENLKGDAFSTRGSIVVVDVKGPTLPAEGPGVAKVKKVAPFAIDDRFDPMVPMSQTKDDLRFVSLLAPKKDLGIYMTDFAIDNPTPRPIRLTMGDTALDLRSSWALRPALVMESSEPARKTKLVLSRGRLIPESDRNVDSARLDILVLERDALDSTDKPFSVTSSTACTVKYTFRNPNNLDRVCLRAFDPRRPMRASPASKIKASQLLAGRFGARGDLGFAFPDYCLDKDPIVLVPALDGKPHVTATERQIRRQRVLREIDCTPLDVQGVLAE
jgi:hypothetical protein